MEWREAVLEAIVRYTSRHGTRTFTRRGLLDEELDRIKLDTATEGATPDQTMSRVLQELRDEEIIDFLDDQGSYLLR